MVETEHGMKDIEITKRKRKKKEQLSAVSTGKKEGRKEVGEKSASELQMNGKTFMLRPLQKKKKERCYIKECVLSENYSSDPFFSFLHVEEGQNLSE